jgi:hypothetical protein
MTSRTLESSDSSPGERGVSLHGCTPRWGAQFGNWSTGQISPVLVTLIRQPLGSEQLAQLDAVAPILTPAPWWCEQVKEDRH